MSKTSTSAVDLPLERALKRYRWLITDWRWTLEESSEAAAAGIRDKVRANTVVPCQWARNRGVVRRWYKGATRNKADGALVALYERAHRSIERLSAAYAWADYLDEAGGSGETRFHQHCEDYRKREVKRLEHFEGSFKYMGGRVTVDRRTGEHQASYVVRQGIRSIHDDPMSRYAKDYALAQTGPESADSFKAFYLGALRGAPTASFRLPIRRALLGLGLSETNVATLETVWLIGVDTSKLVEGITLKEGSPYPRTPDPDEDPGTAHRRVYMTMKNQFLVKSSDDVQPLIRRKKNKEGRVLGVQYQGVTPKQRRKLTVVLDDVTLARHEEYLVQEAAFVARRDEERSAQAHATRRAAALEILSEISPRKSPGSGQ
jgi:hypothetical protein